MFDHDDALIMINVNVQTVSWVQTLYFYNVRNAFMFMNVAVSDNIVEKYYEGLLLICN